MTLREPSGTFDEVVGPPQSEFGARHITFGTAESDVPGTKLPFSLLPSPILSWVSGGCSSSVGWGIFLLFQNLSQAGRAFAEGEVAGGTSRVLKE